jgi:putative ABC transport system permease protein
MIRAAARSLFRQPSFVLAAAGTLAIGIAATTTLFTTVNAALLRPLPYARPGDIYSLRTYFRDGRFTMGLVANEELAAVDPLTDVVAMTAFALRVDGALNTDSKPRQVVTYAVSERFFDLFGVPVETGRAIGADDTVRGAPRVAVLSQRVWRTDFGARPDIVGTLITLADRPVKVVGIAPAKFDMPAGTGVWTNLVANLSIGHPYEAWVRAQPNTPLPLLIAKMNATFGPLTEKYPDWEQDRLYTVQPLLDATVGSFGPILIILFGATALLLALAAVNVTNLMLARTAGRAREVAVRAALGATRGRIIAQLLTESVLIAVLGAVAGATIAWASLRVLLRFGGANLPRLDALSMDFTVIAFVAAVAGMTGVLVGIVPALRMADTDIAALMNETGRSVRGSRATRRLLGAFVIAEIAVAVAIVAGAGRLVRSYQNLQNVDRGFDAQGLLVLDVGLPRPNGPYAEWRNAWWSDTETALRAAGATAAAATSSFPLEPHEWDVTSLIELVAHPNLPPERQMNARLRKVTPDFFKTMGIATIEGRAITDADGLAAQGIAVANQAFGRRNLGGASPIGEQIKGMRSRFENGKYVPDLVTIVGVVHDVPYSTLSGSVEPVLYFPFAQSPPARASIVVSTADGAPERQAAAFETARSSVEPRLAIEATSVPAVVAASLDRERLGMWLMLGFGAAALVLAAVGMFGVIAYVISQQVGELAVRQALGATRGQIIIAVMRDGAIVAAAGVAIGSGIAWWTGRLVSTYVFNVSARDPMVLGISAATVAVLAMIATFVPARRAASTGLARALRD